jgi:UDP-glucose 4-epimerase
MRILITGGAGYIGSHMVWYLLEKGHHTLVVDNLTTGYADAVRGPFQQGDLCLSDNINQIMADFRPDAVMHFAALSLVGESVLNPRRYFHDNLVGALNLLDAMLQHHVKIFIFSSTAATYGAPLEIPIPEDHPQLPVNPYGDSKLAIERMLISYARAYGLQYALLRYFNAAGALPEQGLGERHDPETHLIPLLLRVTAKKSPHAQIFGRDYDTPDGTCIRDYIHVLDLADAHLAALNHLADGGENLALNLGTGSGYSVMEVLECVKAVTKKTIPIVDSPRREGDPPVLIASAERARQVLAWDTRHSDLESIIASAWQFYSNR